MLQMQYYCTTQNVLLFFILHQIWNKVLQLQCTSKHFMTMEHFENVINEYYLQVYN